MWKAIFGCGYMYGYIKVDSNVVSADLPFVKSIWVPDSGETKNWDLSQGLGLRRAQIWDLSWNWPQGWFKLALAQDVNLYINSSAVKIRIYHKMFSFHRNKWQNTFWKLVLIEFCILCSLICNLEKCHFSGSSLHCPWHHSI